MVFRIKRMIRLIYLFIYFTHSFIFINFFVFICLLSMDFFQSIINHPGQTLIIRLDMIFHLQKIARDCWKSRGGLKTFYHFGLCPQTETPRVNDCLWLFFSFLSVFLSFPLHKYFPWMKISTKIISWVSVISIC